MNVTPKNVTPKEIHLLEAIRDGDFQDYHPLSIDDITEAWDKGWSPFGSLCGLMVWASRIDEQLGVGHGEALASLISKGMARHEYDNPPGHNTVCITQAGMNIIS